MVAFYVGQIKRGKMTIEQVPALWWIKVRVMLATENSAFPGGE